MKKCMMIVVTAIGFCLITLPGWTTIYVSDKLEVPLRAAPGPKYKIIDVLKSGQVVNVVSEKDGWSNVSFMDESGNKEGWILSRYLMDREPWESRVTALEKENARLRAMVVPMKKDFSEAKSRNIDLETILTDKTKELESLKQNYESLRRDASGFLELRKRFEKTRSDLTRIEDELAKTTKENESMRSSHSQRWFLAGGLVLFCGLLIGLVMGRREKKRSSKLYL